MPETGETDWQYIYIYSASAWTKCEENTNVIPFGMRTWKINELKMVWFCR